MKRYIYAFILVAFIGGLSACQKDFLERTPMTSISDGDYWRTANDLRFYVNNYYSIFPSYIQQYQTFGIYSLDDYQGSDNMVNRDYSRYLNGERVLPSSGNGWTYGDWSSIRGINYFLNNYQKASGDEAEINKYVGEALFFKAWLYFDKMKTFGDLPWLNKALTNNDSTDLYQGRLSRAIIADSIIATLDRAIELLPAKGGSLYEDRRIYKEVAALFQSRVALYEGTWEKYHAGTPFGVQGSDGTRFLQKAASAAEMVMNSGKFSLDNVGQEDGYWKLFNQLDYSGSNEVMFWREYNGDDGNYTLLARYMTQGGGRGITKSLVDSYLDINGVPIRVSNLYQGDETLVDVTANRDPRLSQTIMVPDGNHYLADTAKFYYPAIEGASEDRNYTGYQLYKGLNTDSRQHDVGQGTQGTIYFRYAEALLNYIEAKAELGTAVQEDVDRTINLLRDRVGMAHLNISNIVRDPYWDFPTLSPLINEVRRERRVEFAAEGYRHDDIWRWAAADELILGWKPKGAKREQFRGVVPDAVLEAQYPIDENGYIFPYKNNVVGANGYQFNVNRDYLNAIPTDQIILNPNITQNPGWN